MTMKRLSFFMCISAILAFQSYAAEAAEAIELGQKLNYESQHLNETRTYSVYLPPSYAANPKKRYPVFYCLDGETHFKASVGTLDWLSKSANAIPEHLIVAIHNHPGRRSQDLVPQGGNPERFQAFQKFLVEELVPFIDKTYRTEPFRIMSGHSLGGMFALSLLMDYPNQFQAFFISSPYFVIDQGQSISTMQSRLPKLDLKQTFIYASLGSETGLRPFYDSWMEVLKTSAPQELSWEAEIWDQESHMTTPVPTNYSGIKALYADIYPEPSSALMQKDVDQIQKHFKALSKNKYGFDISAEDALIQKGILSAQSGDVAAGIGVLKATTKAYPKSWKAQLSLSHLLEAIGQVGDSTEAAIKAQKLAVNQEAAITQMLANRVTGLKSKMQKK